MNPSAFPFTKKFTARLIILAALFCLCLAGIAAVQSVSADSGGFPTPTATLWIFPTWTPQPSPTATMIVLPTQASSVQSEQVSESAQTAQKGLASPAEAQAQPASSQQSGSGLLGKFVIGILVGLVIVSIAVITYWMLRRTGVIS